MKKNQSESRIQKETTNRLQRLTLHSTCHVNQKQKTRPKALNIPVKVPIEGGRYAELTEWNGSKRVDLRFWSLNLNNKILNLISVLVIITPKETSSYLPPPPPPPPPPPHQPSFPLYPIMSISG
jgi:hypothetical protein